MPVLADNSTQKRSYKSLPVQNKRVLVRVDFNVPIDKSTGVVTDESRIQAALPTIQYLIQNQAKVILISHLGRPKGQVNPKYSLRPTVKVLERLLKTNVQFAEDCVGPKATQAVAALKPGEILILENLRFHPEEEGNDPAFAKELSSLADFFIQDAFGAVHRAHASTAQLPALLQSGAGALLEKELSFLTQLRSSPAHPYVAILGGAKVSDKIGVVEAFIERVDALYIGGAMAYTFLKAQGISVGSSLLEAESIDFCKTMLERAKSKGVSIILPADHLIVQEIEKPEAAKITPSSAIQDGWKGVDIGPKTLAILKPILEKAKTIFWNGPAGIFEIPDYAKGTMEIAKILADTAKKGATVVVGGGDSVAAVTKAKLNQDMTYISTGGGASLEFLEGQELPGVKALPQT